MFTTAFLVLALTAGTPVGAGIGSIAAAPLTNSGAASAQGPFKARKPTQYCVRSQITGSRILRMDCRTRAEWLNDGFDPIAEKN